MSAEARTHDLTNPPCLLRRAIFLAPVLVPFGLRPQSNFARCGAKPPLMTRICRPIPAAMKNRPIHKNTFGLWPNCCSRRTGSTYDQPEMRLTDLDSPDRGERKALVLARQSKRNEPIYGSARYVIQVLAMLTNKGNGRATNDDGYDGGGDNLDNLGTTLVRLCSSWRSLRWPSWLRQWRCLKYSCTRRL